jgi:hypothetical protein
MDALEGVPFMILEERRGQIQRENHAPQLMTLPNALFAFREEVERGSIDGLEWTLPRSSDRTLSTFNVDEFVRMEISFRPAEVLGIWPEWPPALAWNVAKTRPWQPPSGIPKGWIRSLPASDYLPFAGVVDFLTFGPAKTAIGLSFVEEQAATLRAGIALVSAAIEGKVAFVGMLCERLASPHLLRPKGPRIMIEPESLGDLIPVPYGGRGLVGAAPLCGRICRSWARPPERELL